MISPRLLEMVRCPETYLRLSEAKPEIVERLNTKIRDGKLFYKNGKTIESQLESGLIREDGKLLYPVRNGLPELLIDKGILPE